MNEQSPVRVVASLFEAFARGDLKEILTLLAEDVEWVLPGEGIIPHAGCHVGRRAVEAFLNRMVESTEFLAFEPREFLAQGDRVVVLGWYRARSRATSQVGEAEFAMAFQVRDGQISKYREYTDTAKAALLYGTGADYFAARVGMR